MKAASFYFLFLSVFTAPLLPMALAHDGHDHDHHDHDEHDDEIIRLSPEVMEEFGIELGKVQGGYIRVEAVFPGQIQFNQEKLAYVTSRLSGSMTDIQARLGDRVERGQLLATLESTETLGVFTVASPLQGVIVEREVTLGQTVEAGRTLFTVADSSSVWADLRIYMQDMGKMHVGLPVLLESSAGGTYQGAIAYIAPVVDAHTRTGLARVVVENPEGSWKPGQFIKGTVRSVGHEVDLVVPKSAVITIDGHSVVFVLSDEGFEVRQLRLGDSDSISFEVIEGLIAGETIATRNVISLKAELGKAAFGGHEGHVH